MLEHTLGQHVAQSAIDHPLSYCNATNENKQKSHLEYGRGVVTPVLTCVQSLETYL